MVQTPRPAAAAAPPPRLAAAASELTQLRPHPATCACCGMDEECTPRYVAWVAAQFGGAWVCGLCAEAIKDEAARRGVGLEAARRAHAEFVADSAAGAGSDGPTVQVVRALLRLLKKVIAAAPAGAAAVLPPATPAPAPPPRPRLLLHGLRRPRLLFPGCIGSLPTAAPTPLGCDGAVAPPGHPPSGRTRASRHGGVIHGRPTRAPRAVAAGAQSIRKKADRNHWFLPNGDLVASTRLGARVDSVS